MKAWEPGSPLEEVYIGGFQVAQGVLQSLTVDFLQPGEGLGLFHCRQLLCLLIVVGTLSGLLILFLALGEKMIVDKADTTKIIRKHFLLLLIWVKPKLICLLYHLHSVQRYDFFLELQRIDVTIFKIFRFLYVMQFRKYIEKQG